MRSSAWSLAVLGAMAALLCPARSDCLGDCRACGDLELPVQLEPSTMLRVCYLQCSGHLTSSLLWELCKRAGRRPQYPPRPAGGDGSEREGVAWEEGEEPHYPDDVAAAAAVAHFPPNGVRYDALLVGSTHQEEEEEEEEEERLEGAELSLEGGVRTPRGEADDDDDDDDDDDEDAVSVSKRFGGFLRSRQGYRKLVGAAPRPLQKRYGGFIGVRKSARKWNSQKRVNQLLRQYLGRRSSRGGGRRYTGVPMATLRRSNGIL